MSAIAITSAAPRTSFLDSLGVLWRAAVLLGRHWPALLAISLAGSAAHGLLLWSAVKASRTASGLGLLVLVLVPLSLLVSLVLMMRVLRPSLPYIAAVTGSGGDGGLGRIFGSVAVPFLTIYTTYDYLKDDVTSFTYEVWRDSDPGTTLARLPFTPSVSVLCIVAVALVIRQLLGQMSWGPLKPVTTPLGAYVEILWVCAVSMGVTQVFAFGSDWLGNREAGVWWHDFWDRLGPVVQPVREVLEAVWGNVEVVILAPIAWLAMGAVVYGRRLSEGRLTDERLVLAALRRASRLPGPLAWVTTAFGGGLYNRFAPLLNGLRMLGRAGLRPMLVFCVCFVVLGFSPDGFWEIERALIGPHDLQHFWFPLSYLTAPINVAIRYALIVCLVGAATDRILEADAATRPAAEEVISEAHSEAVPSR